MDLPARSRAPVFPRSADERSDPGFVKRVAIGALNYLTNHFVNRIPSYRLRAAWYRSVVGASIGDGSVIHLGCYLWYFGPNQMRRNGLRIGHHSRINRDCCLDARDGLWIGDNVSISPWVAILTGEHDADDPAFRYRSKPVRIEDHAWIGTRAMILPGVTVGRGAVVAAGAIVTKDVEPLTIVAGNPARPIRRREVVPSYTLAEPLPLFE
jgi:acetyltransferase-like isoleucine patch superfamily enzyme